MTEQSPPTPSAPRPRRSVFLTVLMAVFGVILLLPGLCSLVFGVMMVGELSSGPNSSGGVSELSVMLPLWLIGMGIGAAGLALIVAAVRR